MAGSLLPFETGKYEYHSVSSFIYEPIFNADGSLKDFRILYASDKFARDWADIYHNEDCLGALLKESTLMDDYSLEMMERFITQKPHAFMTYMPMENLHLYFEPIPDLPAPYAGFYVTNITGQAYRDARDHFLRNIRQMKNNAVLIQRQADGRLDPIFISAEYARMMECSEAEAMARLLDIGILKTTVADDRPLVRSMLERRVAFDGSSRLTIQKLTAKHNKVWVNAHYAFIDDFDEHYIYCTFTDVTTLKAHEERLRSTYSSLGNNFYQAGEMTLANLRVNLTRNVFEEIKGADTYDTDDMNNAYSDAVRLRAVHYPIESERAQFLKLLDRENLMQNYEAGNPNASLMLYSVRGNGRSCFVNISASVTRHPLTGDIVAFITERQCNSEKVKDTLTNKILAQQFDMVAYLVDGSYGVTIGDSTQVHRGGIFPTSRKGDYQAWVERQVLPGLSDDDTRARLREALSLDTVERELRQKEPYVVDLAIEAEGETYYKQFDFYSVNPQARFYILLKSDTTEIQKQHMEMNERLRQALEAAKQANVAKTAFLSNMSHEIRTPMNAIIGLDSIALRDPDLPDRTREQLEKIDSSARHLLNLINDILDMSRIESGRLTLRNEAFSFSEMLEQINTMINSQCQDKGLHYACKVVGQVDDDYIGDAMKLKQVIINILGNAVKFTPEGGSVTLTVECISRFEGQSALRFTMRDTGVGMDAEYLPRIFDPFSQEDAGRSNRYGSTGLGMAITKSIVEQMNGTIAVESEKGVGTTFTVEVTLRDCERRERQLDAVRAQDLRVLVIDDDPVSREHARNVLEEIGIAADTAAGGPEAIEMIQLKVARHEAYNLMFVDWKMPGQNGMEVTKEIRRIVGWDSAMIVLTAYDWDEIEDEAKAAGVDSFMARPLFSSNVLSTFQRVMEDKRLTRQESAPADLTGRRVLIAEDMEINAEILADLLELLDVESEHAENGQVAVEMFDRSAPGYYDAILMDVRMPVMDGLEATRTLRKLPRADARAIPVIAMTANAFDEDVQRSLQAGMNAHLSKPVDIDRLKETLQELIRD